MSTQAATPAAPAPMSSGPSGPSPVPLGGRAAGRRIGVPRIQNNTITTVTNTSSA